MQWSGEEWRVMSCPRCSVRTGTVYIYVFIYIYILQIYMYISNMNTHIDT